MIDDDHALVGTLRPADLVAYPAGHAVGAIAVRGAPVLDPEEDLDGAEEALHAIATDRLLVVDHRGDLLGVLTDRDLARAACAWR